MAVGGHTFGLVEFTSNTAVSVQASDWGAGKVVTPNPKAGEGVISGAFSPDGKHVAMASNIGTYHFQLLIGAHRLRPHQGRRLTGFRVPDGLAARRRELAVMQADSTCSAPTGDIAVLDPTHPRIDDARDRRRGSGLAAAHRNG